MSHPMLMHICHNAISLFPALWAKDKNLGKGYNLSDVNVLPWGGHSFNFCLLHQWLEKKATPICVLYNECQRNKGKKKYYLLGISTVRLWLG